MNKGYNVPVSIGIIDKKVDKKASYNESICVKRVNTNLLTRTRAAGRSPAGPGEQADFERRPTTGKQSQAMLGFGRKQTLTYCPTLICQLTACVDGRIAPFKDRQMP